MLCQVFPQSLNLMLYSTCIYKWKIILCVLWKICQFSVTGFFFNLYCNLILILFSLTMLLDFFYTPLPPTLFTYKNLWIWEIVSFFYFVGLPLFRWPLLISWVLCASVFITWFFKYFCLTFWTFIFKIDFTVKCIFEARLYNDGCYMDWFHCVVHVETKSYIDVCNMGHGVIAFLKLLHFFLNFNFGRKIVLVTCRS